MIFSTAGAAPGTLLWRTVEEAELLIAVLRRHLPGLLAWALMLDHLHVGLATEKDLGRLAVVMRVYARARNRGRGEDAQVWAHRDVTWREENHEDGKRILLRYCSLNPCRKGHVYVRDPLAWPWCSHRDAVGLSLDPLIRPLRDPEEYHAFVVSDPVFARWETCDLPPAAPAHDGYPSAESVRIAVASLLRTTPARLLRDRRQRRIFVAALRTLTNLSGPAIAREARMHPATPYRTRRLLRDQQQMIRRVIGDPRFAPWSDAAILGLARRWHPGRR